MSRLFVTAFAATSLFASATALADRIHKPLVTVPMAAQPHAQAATTLYMNRCTGGCTITKGGLHDAVNHVSPIPEGDPDQQFTITEFAGTEQQWTDFMKCMKEVYSPYGVTVTDQKPAAGIAYNEGIVAGSDREINRSAGGIAPITNDCSPYSNVLSFTFANDLGPSNTFLICAVAAQETGHAVGLDHSYEFVDGSSACRDPMSYREDCGGQRFFRNELARCGEFNVTDCRCGALQNSHLKMNTVLGPGTPITTPPRVSLTFPAAGATLPSSGARAIATAGAQRGVAFVELWINGYKWTEVKGVPFGSEGQPEAGYNIDFPADVPDSVIDLVVKARDDIGATTETASIRVTKGAACTTADTCAKGQRCDEEGRCLWDPPTGELGAVCEYPQFCVSGNCSGTADEQRCTQPCSPQNADSCPDSFECLPSGSSGLCWPATDGGGGCCSAGGDGAAQSLLLGLGLGALVIGRRRRVR